MRVAFRTDASLQIGTGHVMRCLALADALRNQGAECQFISRVHPGHLNHQIVNKGHEIVELPYASVERTGNSHPAHADWLGEKWEVDAEQSRQVMAAQSVDWLIVDHYALDWRWENIQRPYCGRLMVVDDLADRPHDCDLLLDQNLGRTCLDYSGMVNQEAKVITGPRFALLRPEFAEWREKSLRRRANTSIKSILITMGGVDKDNVTGKVLSALSGCDLLHNVKLDIVMGAHSPWIELVRLQAAKLKWETRVLTNIGNIAQIMSENDISIGAAGSTSWERCCLGLPSIQLVLAENQKTIAKALDDAGASIHLNFDNLEEKLPRALNEMNETSKLKLMSSRASSITEGLGSEIVVDYLLKGCHEDYILV